MTRLNIAGFGMDTISFAGGLARKLDAVRDAGFSQVMLLASDLVGHPDGIEAAIGCVRSSGLRPTGFQLLRDFEGLPGPLHDYKVEVAKSLLEMCSAVGSKLLLVGSSTSAHASGEPEVLARDLRLLAMLALPLGVRIAYEALPWGRHVNTIAAAWDIVDRADAPNLGLAFDAFHALAAGMPADDLELLDPQRVFLVQLADFMWPPVPTGQDHLAMAGHFRVFPGEGAHTQPLAEMVLRLHELGYAGDYSFEVFNDDYAQMPQPAVAARARRAAVWLAEDVLRLSTPLPGRMGCGRPEPRRASSVWRAPK